MDDESKITLTATNKREWPNATLKSLNAFRQSSNTLCDVFLHGQGSSEPIPAHRCVLAANSDYFHAMFTSGLAESRRDHRDVSIQGVDRDVLALIVDFLYLGSCRLVSGTLHRIMDLVAAATMLQVNELAHACSAYLERCLDADNALELWLFAERFGLIELGEACLRFVQTYFQLISRSKKAEELDCHEMASLLGLHQVNLGNTGPHEDTMVDLLLRWLEHQPKSDPHQDQDQDQDQDCVRDLVQDLGPLLGKICWAEVCPETRDRVRHRLAEICQHNSPAAHPSYNGGVPDDLMCRLGLENAVPPRQFFCSLCVIGGLQNSRAGRRSPQTSSMEVVDIDVRNGAVLRRWTKPRGFHGPQAAVSHSSLHFLPYRGRLYAFFLRDESRVGFASPASRSEHRRPHGSLCIANVLNANLKMLPSRAWDNMSVWWDLVEKASYVQAIDEVAGVVYLCGCSEQREGASSKRVFKLNIESNTSIELRCLPFGRSHHRAMVVKGELFVLGGVDWLLTPLSTVLKYNPVSNEWEEVSPMHEPRIDGAYVCVDGRIYAAGGSTSKYRSRSVEVYNPCLDIWTSLAPMTLPRVNHGLVAAGGFLFAFGGQSYTHENGGARNVQRTVERYSIAADSWEVVWEMSECRWSMVAFTL